MLVEPDGLGRLALLEEEQVGPDAGVGFEDTVGEPNDGMQVALFEQVLLEPGLDALAEQAAVGQDHGSTATGLEQAYEEGEKQVRGFLGAEVRREVGLDTVLLFAAEGRVGEDDVHPVSLAVADVGPGQGVVVAHEAGVLDAVEQQVGDAEHMRELLLLHRAQASL